MKPPGILRLVLRIAPAGKLREAMLGDLEQEFELRRRAHGEAAARSWALRQAVRSVGPCLRLRMAKLFPQPGGVSGRSGLSHKQRCAARALRDRPLRGGLVILTFALGIGLNTAILATASQLLLAPLPYPDADRLVVPWPGRAIPGELLAGILEDSSNFDALAFWWDRASAEYHDPADPGGRAVGYTVATVSRAYLDLLGLEPDLGRTFRDDDVPPPELRAGVHRVVLTHHSWIELFDADPAVVGTTVRNGPFDTEIIGVMPPEATPMAQGLDGWSVVGFERELARIPRAHFQVLARLEADGVLGVARMELETRLARTAGTDGGPVRDLPPLWTVPATFGPVWAPVEEQTLVPLRVYLSGNARGGLLLLMVAGVATFLVALVNASALALDRGLERRREGGLRLALGGSRRELVELLFIEQLVLAGAGGAAALGLAWLWSGLLSTLLPGDLPHALVRAMGHHAVGWTLVGCLLCGIAATAVASVALTRTTVWSGVAGRAGGRTVTAARRSLSGLLALQVALITVLMIGAGLLLRTAHRLESVDAGFSWDRTGVVTLQATGLWQRHPERRRGEVLDGYYGRVISDLEAVAGVEAVGQGIPPFASPVSSLWEITDGERSPRPGRPDLEAGWRMVGPGDYFGALGVPLLHGRPLQLRDAPDSPASAPTVALVNELFARRLWPGGDPVGRTFHLTAGDTRAMTIRVVGVVGTYRSSSLDDPPMPLFFTRLPPGRSASTAVLVRVQGAPRSLIPRLVEVVAAVDPRVPVLSAKPLSSVVEESLRNRQAGLWLLGGLAVIGLALGLLGIYGVTALDAARRRRELGIRIALGARTASLIRVVAGRGLMVVAAGLGAGLAAAVLLAPLLEGMLFEVQPVDPVTFLTVPSILLATAVVASLVPALRATRLDPMETLRDE